MANQKISALTSASTPLAGTEVLPIVQSGATVKVSVDNLTTGKNVKAASLSVNTTSTVGKITVNGDVQAQGAFGTISGSLGVAMGAASGAISGNDMCVIAGEAYSNYKDLLISPRNNGADVGNSVFVSGDVKASVGNFVVGTSGKGIDFSATPNTGTSELFADYEEGTFTPTDNSGAGLSLTQTGQATYVKSGTQVTCTMDVTYPATASTATASIAFPFSTATSSSFVGQIGYQSVGSYLSPSGDGTGFNFWNIAGSPQTNANLSGKRLQITFTYRSAT